MTVSDPLSSDGEGDSAPGVPVDRPLCPACSYDITGLDTERCPECGRPTDGSWRREPPSRMLLLMLAGPFIFFVLPFAMASPLRLTMSAPIAGAITLSVITLVVGTWAMRRIRGDIQSLIVLFAALGGGMGLLMTLRFGNPWLTVGLPPLAMLGVASQILLLHGADVLIAHHRARRARARAECDTSGG